MKQVVGTVTIGQSPRVDVVPEIAAILGDSVEIREAGALDGMNRQEITALAPQKGDYVLVTRLADGSSVQVAERHITPRIVERIRSHFDNGVSLVLLLCTGEFPSFESGGLLIRPQNVLFNAVQAVAEGRRLGVLTPSPDQIPQSEHRWKEASGTVKSVAASPYVEAEASVKRAALELKAWGTELTILNCIGYTQEMKETVRHLTGAPAITGRGIAARMVRELLG